VSTPAEDGSLTLSPSEPLGTSLKLHGRAVYGVEDGREQRRLVHAETGPLVQEGDVLKALIDHRAASRILHNQAASYDVERVLGGRNASHDIATELRRPVRASLEVRVVGVAEGLERRDVLLDLLTCCRHPRHRSRDTTGTRSPVERPVSALRLEAPTRIEPV
jgi:hypothetical protein